MATIDIETPPNTTRICIGALTHSNTPSEISVEARWTSGSATYGADFVGQDGKYELFDYFNRPFIPDGIDPSIKKMTFNFKFSIAGDLKRTETPFRYIPGKSVQVTGYDKENNPTVVTIQYNCHQSDSQMYKKQ